MADSLPIEGPLGYWTFPVLNALVLSQRDDKENSVQVPDGKLVEIATITRDSSGNIEKVEVTKVD